MRGSSDASASLANVVRASGVTAFACVVALQVTGCAGSGSAVRPEPGPAEARLGVAVVGEQDAGREIRLDRGDVLEARVPGYVAQGYSIRLGSIVTPVLAQDGPARHVDDAERAIIDGAGTFEVWRFRAAQSGRTTVRFDYRRQWESGPATKSLAYEVVVR